MNVFIVRIEKEEKEHVIERKKGNIRDLSSVSMEERKVEEKRREDRDEEMEERDEEKDE